VRRVLMLVWTGVASDTRVLREAAALVADGCTVHIIGRAVPETFIPGPGITVDSGGAPPSAQTRARTLGPLERAARWVLLPRHVRRRLARWQRDAAAAARRWARVHGPPQVVHVHDLTALPTGAELAGEWGVPLIYDSHEYWAGRPVEGRPAPLLRWAESRLEHRLGARADAVLTVGDGVAAALRRDHPSWPEITVVHNTFPARPSMPVASPPTAFVYAGRLAADRELEVVAGASHRVGLPVVLRGPADESWLARFDPGAAQVRPAVPLAELDDVLSAAGAALVTHSDRWENHRLALPNKVFHAVSLGVPVVATDVGELGALVRRHGLGTLYRPGDADDLVRACHDLVAGHADFRHHVARAQDALGWEADAARLVEVHRRLGGGGTSTTLPGSDGRSADPSGPPGSEDDV
jgi:glycogen synthase